MLVLNSESNVATTKERQAGNWLQSVMGELRKSIQVKFGHHQFGSPVSSRPFSIIAQFAG